MEKENIYATMSQEEISNLIKFSPANLLEFFNDALYVHDDKVPPYGKLINEPVTFKVLPYLTLNRADVKDMIDEEANEEDSGPIEFKCTKFQYNFVPGSQSSINFHESLAETSTENVF